MPRSLTSHSRLADSLLNAQYPAHPSQALSFFRILAALRDCIQRVRTSTALDQRPNQTHQLLPLGTVASSHQELADINAFDRAAGWKICGMHDCNPERVAHEVPLVAVGAFVQQPSIG